MSLDENRRFRTHTIRFLKKDLKEERNCRSLLARHENKKHLYCGSLLQIIKYYDNQRRKRVNVPNNHFLTITNDFERQSRSRQCQQKQQNKRFSQFQTFYPDNTLRTELRHQFRIKEGPRSNTVRKQQQKFEFNKLINDFNAKTKEILERKEKSHLLRRSINKNEESEAKVNQISHNFYQFRALKNFKHTLSTKQESEDLEINYEITPW